MTDTTAPTPSTSSATTTDAAPSAAAPAATPAIAPAGEAPAGEAPSLLNSVAADGKPAEGAEAKGDGEEGEEGKPAAAAVPEAYELQAPEGFTIAPESVELVTPVFKELGLSNEQANKLMPVAAKFAQQIQQQMLDAHTATTADWGKQALADPELGGGSTETFNQNLGIAAKALDDLATPEFRKFLDDTGLGNHPDMIRFALRAGKAISDEARIFRTDSAATPAKPDRLSLLYADDLPKT